MYAIVNVGKEIMNLLMRLVTTVTSGHNWLPEYRDIENIDY